MLLRYHLLASLLSLTVAHSTVELVSSDISLPEIARRPAANITVLLHSHHIVGQCELNTLFEPPEGFGPSPDAIAAFERVAHTLEDDSDWANVEFVRPSTLDIDRARVSVFLGKHCQASLAVNNETPWHLLPDWLAELDLPLTNHGEISEGILSAASNRSIPVLITDADFNLSKSYGFLGGMRSHTSSAPSDHPVVVQASTGYCNPLLLKDEQPLCRRQLIVFKLDTNETKLVDFATGEIFFYSGQQSITDWVEDYFYSRLEPDASVVHSHHSARDYRPDILKMTLVGLLVVAPHYWLLNFNVASAISVLVVAFGGSVPGSVLGVLLVVSYRARDVSNLMSRFSSYLALGLSSLIVFNGNGGACVMCLTGSCSPGS